MKRSVRFAHAAPLILAFLLPACGRPRDDASAGREKSVLAETEAGTSGEHATAAASSRASTSPQETAAGSTSRDTETSAADSAGRNRLARETSPYLVQHADNPVDWHPWGPEAFEKARQENKPIFLSIGYSSCHWCHVMERKVFENEEIARFMNEHFVNIKVDREERPDVDEIYMNALLVYQRATGAGQGGGWPLSMFLTPQGKPFAGGTYFPPEGAPEQGRPGFRTVMHRVDNLWNNRRQDIEQNAEMVTRQVRRLMEPSLALESVDLERQLVTDAIEAVKETYDPKYGGVDFDSQNPDAPKFPAPTKLALLQYAARRQGDEQAEEMVGHTLEMIARGGIRDHVGGGFHRYSTDRRWHVPHFEKMLYDQALLTGVYAAAFRRTDDGLHRRVVEETFAFVLREMTASHGGFYSALNAESEGEEGAYYVWSAEEVQRILGTADARLFKGIYGLNEPQTFEPGYVLRLTQQPEQAADELGMSPAELKRRLADMRKKLFEARSQRERPSTDDKVITSWNGLMIRALAEGGDVLGRDTYLQSAEQAAEFLLDTMRDDEGRLLRTYRAGTAHVRAYLDDYAFLTQGLLALHRVTEQQRWLEAARRLTDEQIRLFWDEQSGGFFFTQRHQDDLIAETKNAYDSALPSGNSVSVRNLIRLASLTGREKYRQHARKTLEAFAPSLKRHPRRTATLAVALGEFLDNPDFAAARGALTESATSAGEDDGPIRLAGAETSQADSTGDDGKEKKQPERHVKARAFLSVDRLPAGRDCRTIIILDVEKGWHINANPAQPDSLIPTEFTITSRHGTKLSDVRYPQPKKLDFPEIEEPLHVYEGRIAIRGTLQVPADAAGKTEELQLHIQYQPCDDSRCLAKQALKLKGQLPVAAADESVKQINENLFPELESSTKK